jgi:hypothetical protein
MPTFAETVRDHYQAGIKDETELLTRLNRIIDEIEPPLTAEKFAAFDQFHVGVDWIANQQLQLRQATQRGIALTTGMVVGERMREMVANFGHNLTEGRLRLVMGKCRAA